MGYSLIIPIYNSSATIKYCLDSCLNQSIGKMDYEILVVNDGSTDNTLKLISDYPVRVISQTRRGPASARNRGAENAKGSILIFTDADCEPDYYFVENITKPFSESPEIAGVQGSYKTRQNEFMARFIQLEIDRRYLKMRKDKYIDFVGTYAAAYKKSIFIENGGFDTSFFAPSAEDMEFSYRLHSRGYKLVFASKAFVYHTHPSIVTNYCKSKFRSGFWRINVYLMYPQKTLNDSYTPQPLKIQVCLIPVLFLSIVFLLFYRLSFTIIVLIILFFCLSSLPFLLNTNLKNPLKYILIPTLLILRALSLAVGIGIGISKIAWKRLQQ